MAIRKNRSVRIILVCLAYITLECMLVQHASSQSWSLTGGRALSRNGRWMAPVASSTLSSDEDDHKRRGSVDAWDVSAPFGSPVYPMGPGQVMYAGCNNAGGYGCWALIDHKDGYTSLYAHLIDEGDGKIWVEQEQLVGAWTPLGRLGWTGTTSFGPHVHWEIRKSGEGRIRVDELFPRYRMDYCKFCSSDETGNATFGGLRSVVGQQATASLVSLATSRYMALLIVALLLAASLARPRVPLRLAQGVGSLALRGGRASKETVGRFRDTQAWSFAHVALIILIPAILCGSTSAIAVWMTDEGLSAREVWRSIRFGLSPLVGPGYDRELRHAAVWGTPCSGVGSLGRVCTPAEIADLGLNWRDDVFFFTASRPGFAVIPRLNPLFGYGQARQLIDETHSAGGLVIVDVEADIEQAEEVIKRLTPFGLDGIAIDIEFADIVTAEELKRVGLLLAAERQKVGLQSDGLVIIWDVFHNVRMNSPIDVKGVQVIPIFTGYGSTNAKVSGLAVTQRLFGSDASNSGLMAFDQRWPVNATCTNLGMEAGFDCQSWRTLFSKPVAQDVGWWVQQ